MYVGPIGSPNMIYDQINFQIPADAPAEGIVPIQVCVGSVCSDLVEVEFTAQDIVLRLVGEAHVHMPIWIQVEIPMNLGFSYPHSTCPWDFGGYEFEIRRNGQLLAPKSKPECPHGPMRLVNISTSSKLPLHLVGQFDSPGAYEVRLTGPILAPDMTKVARFGQSDWMLFTVEAYSDEERVAWLREIAENADKPSGRHSAELIVSLLAWPDEKALATLIRFLPPPPTTPSSRRVSGNFSHVMYCLAPKSLAAFPEAVVRILMSTERLKQIRDAAMRCQ